MCTHRIWEPDGLICTREDPHDIGHVYRSSAVPDAHDETEAAAEGTRG